MSFKEFVSSAGIHSPALDTWLAAFEGLPHAVFITEMSGTIISANTWAARLLGYDPSEMVGWPLRQLIDPNDHTRLMQSLTSMLSEGHAVLGDGEPLQITDKLGRGIAVEVFLSSLGAFTGDLLVCEMFDVTRRYGMNKALRDSEERYRTLVNRVQDEAVFMLDARGCVASWNPGAEKMNGYRADEIIGKHFSLLHTPEDVAAGKPDEELRTVSEVGRFEQESWRVRKDGSRVFVHVTTTAVFDQTGQLTGFAKVIRDLTDVLRQERKFQQVVESAPNAMVMCDSAGLIVLVNARAEQDFGYARHELLGHTIEILMPEKVRSRHPSLRHLYGMNPQARRMGTVDNLLAQRKDGTVFPVEIGLTPIETAEGRVTLAVIVDISKRKAAESALKTLNRALEAQVQRRTFELTQTVKELESFSYSVAHDLRSPVRTMTSYSQILLQNPALKADPESAPLLEKIRQAGLRMASFIDALLSLSRLGRQPVHVQSVDLGAIARDIVQHLREAEIERNVQVEIQPGLVARADPVLIRGVLDNLLRNAWKFTGRTEQAHIRVAAEHDSGEPVFLVQDNGCGFDMAHATRLFGAFQRLHHANEYEGTGIGLATVFRIIQRHGGRIWAESKPGEGATFRFTLPLTATDEPANA